MEQRSEEWYAARLGIPTASSFNKLITSTGKPSSQAQGYINQLIAERVTGRRPESHTSEAMQRGIEMEADAVAWYELMTDQEVTETGFHRHPEIDCGASPDGLVGEGLLEIKCMLAHNHIACLRKEAVPSTYIPQVQGQLFVLDRPWCDFVSFHPELPPMLIRVERDEQFIEALASILRETSDVVSRESQKLMEKMK